MSQTEKKWTLKRVVKEVFTTLLLVLIISLLINYLRQPNVTENIYQYQLRDIENNAIEFFEYENEPLIVHFWGTWCPTCRFESSTIESLSNKHNVISIAVTSGTDEEISKYMSDNNLDYPVINDNKGALAQKFDIEIYPTTFIYNSKGELAFSEVGYITSVGLEARLALID